MESRTVVDNLFAAIGQPVPKRLHVYEYRAWGGDIWGVVLKSWVKTARGYKEDEEILEAVQVLPYVRFAEESMGCCRVGYKSEDGVSVEVLFSGAWVPFKIEGA